MNVMELWFNRQALKCPTENLYQKFKKKNNFEFDFDFAFLIIDNILGMISCQSERNYF